MFCDDIEPIDSNNRQLCKHFWLGTCIYACGKVDNSLVMMVVESALHECVMFSSHAEVIHNLIKLMNFIRNFDFDYSSKRDSAALNNFPFYKFAASNISWTKKEEKNHLSRKSMEMCSAGVFISGCFNHFPSCNSVQLRGRKNATKEKCIA